MAYRGRGRGRGGFGGSGRGFGGSGRGHKQEEFIIFPDVELPDPKSVAFETKLVNWNNKFEMFWKASPYHLKEVVKTEDQDTEIERFRDRSEKNKIAHSSLQDFLVLRKDNFPLELIGRLQSRKKRPAQMNLDSDLVKFDLFEKLEQKHQGQEGDDPKQKKEEEDEDGEGEINDEDEGQSDDDDYNQNIDFDDDDDDYNVEDNDDEPFYD